MNSYFDENKIKELYPGAEDLMVPAMLIWKLPAGKEHMMSEVCENREYFGTLKIDGAWYQFTTGADHKPWFNQSQAYLFGRTISRVTGLMTEKGANVPHIMTALDRLPPQTALIGEIYFPGGTAKDTVSIMGCLAPEAIKRQENPQGSGPIHYYIHDIIAYNGVNLMGTGAWDRYRILQAIWKKHHLDTFAFLRLATVVEDDIEDEVSRILSSGGEGMVLKKRDAVYSPGKRPAWSAIKFKQMDDVDLVCTRTIPATKEYTGKDIDTWPYWILEDPHGKQCGQSNAGGYNATNDDRFIGIRHCNPEYKWIPVTKPYYYHWHTTIGIGAYDQNGQLVELGTVSSGLTDEDRADMGENSNKYIGQVVSLHCMSIDKREKTLRHPVFKNWRPDKNAQDCKIKEIFG